MNIKSVNFGLDRGVNKISFQGTISKKQQASNNVVTQDYKKLSLEQLQNMANISFGSNSARLNAQDVAWLKGHMTPEQFEKAKKLFYIPQKGDKQLSREDICLITTLDNDKFEKAQKLLRMPEISNKLNGYDISALVELEYFDLIKAIKLMQIPQRGDSQFSGNEAAIITQLNRQDYKKAQRFFYVPERGQRQFSAYDICYGFVRLNDKQLEKARRLYYSPQRGDKQFKGGEICAIARLKDDQYRKAQDFFYIPQRGNKQFDGYEISKLASLEDDSLELAKHLLLNPKYQITKDEICNQLLNFAIDNNLVKTKELQEPLDALKIATIVSRYKQQMQQ